MDYRLTTFDDLAVGQEADFTKTVTEADIDHFVAITGDTNPLHVDAEFAGQTFFGERIAHGMLSAALFSTLVGLHLPGIGAIYRSQTLQFLRPVHIGDTITARLRITAIDREAERIEMESWIDNQRGERVIEGTTVASLLRKLKK
ncbi:MAG: enoyl-CoA hydratase [Proteobacteria bacterium]|nr:MAG: enoyl-CoA hydratase [Pseudomonadota bacterium]QKK10264.1 MAG: MaoC family dehydratase [Pseudomonadota bacterium]